MILPADLTVGSTVQIQTDPNFTTPFEVVEVTEHDAVVRAPVGRLLTLTANPSADIYNELIDEYKTSGVDPVVVEAAERVKNDPPYTLRYHDFDLTMPAYAITL